MIWCAKHRDASSPPDPDFEALPLFPQTKGVATKVPETVVCILKLNEKYHIKYATIDLKEICFFTS